MIEEYVNEKEKEQITENPFRQDKKRGGMKNEIR